MSLWQSLGILGIVWVLVALGAGHFIAAGAYDDYGKNRPTPIRTFLKRLTKDLL